MSDYEPSDYEPEDESGFMTFAVGWNQTVKGWYHQAAGGLEAAYGSATGDDQAVIEGGIEYMEGEAQTERGYNLMGSGVSEMLGLVDHGDEPEESSW